jgi:hypothetical protein
MVPDLNDDRVDKSRHLAERRVMTDRGAMMSRTWRAVGVLTRLFLLLGLGAVVSLVLLGLSLVPDLVRFLPPWIRQHPIEWAAVALLAGYSYAWTIRRARQGTASRVDRLARGLDRVEAVSGTLLERWLAVGFVGLSALWLLLWLPHYLYWPWCRDADSYAQMALDWDCGVLPYRDIRSFNFPGHIYVHWVLGKLLGWGHTGYFYALDATVLLILGAVVMAWSRRRLGLSLPGATAYLIFLAYYLELGFESVAERDWHAPLCTTLGLLLLEAWPGRRSRWLSAILAAVAFTIRPNVVLFFPALLFAAVGGDLATRGAGPADLARPALKRTILRALEWICVFGVFAAIGFAPVVLSGLLGDFVRGVALVRRGGTYSDATSARSVTILLKELSQPKTWALGISLVLLAFRSPDRDLKVTAHCWLLALAGALAYRPIHPRDHGYLATPLELVGAVAWAIPITWIVRTAAGERRIGIAALPGLLAILLIVYESAPMRFPGSCSLHVSVDSLRAAATGGWPILPPGAWLWYGSPRASYSWDSYCRLLKYIRETTAPTTIVANVLKNPPFPSTNGAVGRRSPFRVESGVPWMWVVAEDLDETFAGELERLGCDSIVVWSPDETEDQAGLPLRRLTAVILDRYAPEARFGTIEVWRRKSPKTESTRD